jgi:hypothetical protein
VYRAIKLIVSAILLSRPGMPAAEATRYAHVLQEEGIKRGFDPLSAVAIVHFETHWQPGLVSPDGEDYGLGQVRARYVGACRDDADPLNDPSEACRAVKASLLDGETNLRRMGVIITANRELCKEKTGTADFPQWLAGYEGLNFPGRDKWCAPIAKTFQVIAYRKQLVDTLVFHAKPGRVALRTPAPAHAPAAHAPPVAVAPSARKPAHPARTGPRFPPKPAAPAKAPPKAPPGAAAKKPPPAPGGKAKSSPPAK